MVDSSMLPTTLGNEKEHELFWHRLFEHPQESGYPGKIPGTSQVPSLETQGSRLSFPATGPPDPGRVSEGFQKGSLKGSVKGF